MSNETAPPVVPGREEKDLRMWAMILHLSALSGIVTGGLGFFAPIVIWQIKKDDLPGLEPHGKAATNWILSMLIYTAGAVLLAFMLIGIPILIGLGLISIILPIIAGIKANNGEQWNYPLTMKLI